MVGKLTDKDRYIFACWFHISKLKYSEFSPYKLACLYYAESGRLISHMGVRSIPKNVLISDCLEGPDEVFYFTVLNANNSKFAELRFKFIDGIWTFLE